MKPLFHKLRKVKAFDMMKTMLQRDCQWNDIRLKPVEDVLVTVSTILNWMIAEYGGGCWPEEMFAIVVVELIRMSVRLIQIS